MKNSDLYSSRNIVLPNQINLQNNNTNFYSFLTWNFQNNTADADSSDVELLEHCFGKIKSSLGLYPKLRARLDRNVRAARMDKIVGLLKEKV